MDDPKTVIGELLDLYEMTNISPVSSGLGKVVYVSPQQGKHKIPRIKISGSSTKYMRDNYIEMDVDPPYTIVGRSKDVTQDDIKHAQRWCVLNRELLYQLWNSEIDGIQFAHKMKRL